MKHLFTGLAGYDIWRLSTLGIFAPIGQQFLVTDRGVELN
jgi:hypothetical protein